MNHIGADSVIDYADIDEFLELEKKKVEFNKGKSKCYHFCCSKTVSVIPMSSIQLYPFIFRGKTSYGHFVTRLLTVVCLIAYVSIFVVQTQKIGKFLTSQERWINYETNSNLSKSYNNITPFKTTPIGDIEHKNLPFYYHEGTKNTTCEQWQNMTLIQ